MLGNSLGQERNRRLRVGHFALEVVVCRRRAMVLPHRVAEEKERKKGQNLVRNGKGQKNRKAEPIPLFAKNARSGVFGRKNSAKFEMK
jgi:hypothetical protein